MAGSSPLTAFARKWQKGLESIAWLAKLRWPGAQVISTWNGLAPSFWKASSSAMQAPGKSICRIPWGTLIRGLKISSTSSLREAGHLARERKRSSRATVLRIVGLPLRFSTLASEGSNSSLPSGPAIALAET